MIILGELVNGILRVRGGSSPIFVLICAVNMYSPRARR